MTADEDTDLIRRALLYFARVPKIKRPRSRAARQKAIELSERFKEPSQPQSSAH